MVLILFKWIWNFDSMVGLGSKNFLKLEDKFVFLLNFKYFRRVFFVFLDNIRWWNLIECFFLFDVVLIFFWRFDFIFFLVFLLVFFLSFVSNDWIVFFFFIYFVIILFMLDMLMFFFVFNFFFNIFFLFVNCFLVFLNWLVMFLCKFENFIFFDDLVL